MRNERLGMANVPTISVILPVFNGERWIAESLCSLKKQTFQDFEIILIDDGCTDNTVAIATGMGLSSLRVIQGPQQGLGAALACGVLMSRSLYVARQDQDDLSEPLRFEKQVTYMNRHVKCVIVGSWAQIIDEQGTKIGMLKVPKGNRSIKLALNLDSPFVHTSVLLRRDSVISAGNYFSDNTKVFAEDFDLWSRMASEGDFHNIQNPLVSYRKNPSGITATQGQAVSLSAFTIALGNTEATLDERLSLLDRQLLSFYFGRHRHIRLSEALRLHRLLLRLWSRSGFPSPRHGVFWRRWRAPLVWLIRPPRSNIPFWVEHQNP